MKKTVCYALIALILVLSFTACDEFFSNSWGTTRDYDPEKIDLNAANVSQWVDQAIGNPDLADAILKKIKQEMKKQPKESKDWQKLQQAGIKLAVESSGLGEAIVSNALDALSKLDKETELDETLVKDILSGIQDDFNSSGGVNAAENLADIVIASLDGSFQDGDPPKFSEAFAESADPSDVAEAILVLVLGILGDEGKSVTDDDLNWNDVEDLAKGLAFDNHTDPTHPHIVIDTSTNDGNLPDDKTLALAAYLNLIVDHPDKFGDNPLTETIRDAFFNN